MINVEFKRLSYEEKKAKIKAVLKRKQRIVLRKMKSEVYCLRLLRKGSTAFLFTRMQLSLPVCSRSKSPAPDLLYSERR